MDIDGRRADGPPLSNIRQTEITVSKLRATLKLPPLFCFITNSVHECRVEKPDEIRCIFIFYCSAIQISKYEFIVNLLTNNIHVDTRTASLIGQWQQQQQ